MARLERATTDEVRRKLGAVRIAILIIAASTPLATVVGTAPLGLAFGGTSIVVGFIFSGILIALFCFGYGEMSRRITRPGAFYSYVTRAFGPHAGVATAFVAVLAYVAFLAGALAIPSFYASEILRNEFGIDIHWGVYAAVIVISVTAASLAGMDFNAKVIGIVIAMEMFFVLALVVGIIAVRGLEAFPLAVFAPSAIADSNFGVAIVFSMMCFVGFESAALYAPEAKHPEKSVRGATFIAVSAITVTYAVSTWVLIGFYGVAGAQEEVLLDIGNYVFIINTEVLGALATTALSMGMIISQFVSVLAITNVTARYISSIAKEGLLPRKLGLENSKTAAPTTAILVTMGTVTLIVAVMGVFGLDPYTDISSILFGLGIVAISVLQIAASAAVIRYFAARRETRGKVWSTLVAPILAILGIGFAVYLMVSQFALVTGKDIPAVLVLPLLIPVVALVGVIYAAWLKNNRPETYDVLGAGDSYDESVLAQTGLSVEQIAVEHKDPLPAPQR